MKISRSNYKWRIARARLGQVPCTALFLAALLLALLPQEAPEAQPNQGEVSHG